LIIYWRSCRGRRFMQRRSDSFILIQKKKYF